MLSVSTEAVRFKSLILLERICAPFCGPALLKMCESLDNTLQSWYTQNNLNTKVCEYRSFIAGT